MPSLDQSLSTLPGVGPKLMNSLSKLGLKTVRELIWHFPHRYDDFRNQGSLDQVELGVPVTLTGQLWGIKNVFTRNHKQLTQAVFNDGTNSINLVWFNSHWLINQLHIGKTIRISGKLQRQKNGLVMTMPVWEKVGNQAGIESIHTGRLVPVYSETYGLTSKWIRGKIAGLLNDIESEITEIIPDEIRQDKMPIRQAIREIHFPTDLNHLESARQRLAFDELFLIQLATLSVRAEWQSEQKFEPYQINSEILNDFYGLVDFELTTAQRRVIDEAVKDLTGVNAMNRLLQGDVGSGKTVVAGALSFAVVKNGKRVVIMAPTEVLAKQHFATLQNWFGSIGIKVDLLTGSEKSWTTNNNSKEPDIIVGTHALIASNFYLDKVGLVIIDEQHRFGVNQRAKLREMAEIPHFLSMTATPIPRTVALTMYGDLDISVVDEMPKNRLPVKTYLVPQNKRGDAYKFIAEKMTGGDQVYVVVPLIEESESMVSVKAVKAEYERLEKIFAGQKLGMLHGRMKPSEKTAVIERFRKGDVQMLVATPVVEVGVDVANATIMVIEGAERFGLASLHQLRGRVGRGSKESFCFLFMSENSPNETERLKLLCRMNNGLELAEMDLKIRGSGEVFGYRQSGRFELKIASLSDLRLITETREAAKNLIAKDSRLDKYPQLKLKLSELVKDPSPD